jgi:hypothetical protein
LDVTDALFDATGAGRVVHAALMFTQNLIPLCDWTPAGYFDCMVKVCKLLRRFAPSD